MLGSQILPPVHSAYDYALLSSAVYSDALATSNTAAIPDSQRLLLEKGWNLAEFIRIDSEEGNGYRGGIWVNDVTEQVVIAHRGSKNLQSWLTDLESVVRGRPSGFIKEALNLLSHPVVIAKRAEGYRISTTGHSLGGFLAQICTFWSHRRDMESSYFPNMSAIVFDSPGAADLMELMRSHLRAEQASISIENLNIQNFVARPNIVNTFGVHTGTIWQIRQRENIGLGFVLSHKLSDEIIPAFNSEIGHLTDYRQITDWPQADYSNLTHLATVGGAATAVIASPFRILNHSYQHLKSRLGMQHKASWLDRCMGGKEVQSFLQEAAQDNYRPDLAESAVKALNLAIAGHYGSISPTRSIKTIGVQNFDVEVRGFLAELQILQTSVQGIDALEQALQAKFTLSQQEMNLLNSYELKQYDNKKVFELKASYNGDIFCFQTELQTLLLNNPTLVKASFNQFISEYLNHSLQEQNSKLHKLEADFGEAREGSNLARRLQSEVNTQKEEISSLRKLLATFNSSSPLQMGEFVISNLKLEGRGGLTIAGVGSGAMNDSSITGYGGITVGMMGSQVDPRPFAEAAGLQQGGSASASSTGGSSAPKL
jgi:hypothetical protein